MGLVVSPARICGGPALYNIRIVSASPLKKVDCINKKDYKNMNDQTIKRFFSAPRALRLYGVRRGAMMLLTTLLLTMTAQTAWADDMNIVATGQTISDETTWQNCTVNITGNGTVYFSKRINISGAVTLNLGEGATLTDIYGIHVSEGNSLTIAGTGNLITGGTYQSNAGRAAGIGGNSYETCGTINITGGNITARGYSAAGIGGGGYGGGGGSINISGGNVTATGDGWSAGIGGGDGSNGVTGAAGTINISGGVVNANGSAGGAGIGGGGYSNGTGGAGGTITISGGQVTARGGNSGGSGIGTGYGTSNGGSEGTITLSWTDDTDWIDANSYVGNIGFVEGKRFYYYDTADYVDANGLYKQSKKIVPAIANNSSLAFAVIQMPRSYVTTNGTAVTVSYEVYDYNSNKLTLGTDYNAIIKNSSNEEVTTFDQLGDYTLTVTGTGTYTGSKTYTFSLVEWDLELTQDGSGYYINLPENGTKTVSLNVNQSIKVYDSGGKDGALVASDGRLLLQAPDGYALEVTGKTDAMRYNTANSLWVNSLSAYEGDNTSNEIINLLTDSDNILFASGGNVMRMRLNVTALYTFASQYGLDLTVRVIPQQSHTITKGTVSNGSIDIADNKTTANTNEMITLTVNPAEGYLLKRITITDTDGGSTLQTIGEDQWYSGVNTISFKMPSRNITITPEFTNSLTAAGGLSMNIDLSGTKEYVIPEIVQSFNIRASAVDNPTGWGYATIILRAHNEYSLQATGQIEFINVSTDDGEISIYDGANTSATLLTNIKGASKETVSIGTQTSSSNYMTIYLSEEGPYNSVFTGTIETQIKNYSITYDLTGGIVATENPTTYNYKTEAFTLTNPTRYGYEFTGWTGTGLDAANTSVTIAKGSTGEREYTATWTPITYNITYNNAVNGTDGVTNTNPATYTIESETFTLANPSRTGYEFAGWYSDAEFNTSATTTIAQGSTGDKTFWAKWTRPMTVIVNVTGNGTVTYNDKSATDGTSFGVMSEKGTDVTLTLAPESGYAVSIEYGYTNNSGTTASGIKLPINGTTATLTVPDDMKDGTYVNLTVTFVSALAGGADEATAVALTGNTVTNFAGGWYKVDSDITFDHTLNLLGDTHLIIADDKTMTVNTATSEGILSDYTLFVSGEGTLSVATTDIAVCVGSYVQTGATVTASGSYGIRCSDNFAGVTITNDFTFSGGQLTATGSGGGGIWADMDITLSCTNATDFILASSYSSGYDAVKIAEGNALTDGTEASNGMNGYSGTLTNEQITAIGGETLHRAVTTSYVEASGTLHENVIAIPLDDTMTTLAAGWYVVNENVDYTGQITLSGNVTLILGDGCTMSFGKEGKLLNATIIECNNHNLTIYGQSGGTGWLKAYSAQYYGINAVNDYKQYSGNVLIRHNSAYCIDANNSVALLGGTLDVESGGSGNGDISGRSISILGGKLWARHNGLWGPQGITLGYTNTTDQIYVTIYHAGGTGLQIADGKTLVDDYGVIWSGTLNNDQIEHGINGRTLKPLDYTGVTLTKEGNNVSATFSGSSETTVSIPVDVNVTSVTYNRTFTEGKPSTVMLPFSKDVSEIGGGKFYTFGGVEKKNNKWEATMNEVTGSLTANTPYLFVPTGTSLTVTGGATLNTTGGGNCLASDAEGWVFHGTYSKKLWNEVETHDYGFAATSGTSADNQDVEAGQFVRLTTGASARPMRCYLSYVGSNTPNAGSNDNLVLTLPKHFKILSVDGQPYTGNGQDLSKGSTIVIELEAGYNATNVEATEEPIVEPEPIDVPLWGNEID